MPGGAAKMFVQDRTLSQSSLRRQESRLFPDTLDLGFRSR